MAFTRPTLAQIIARIKADYKSGLGLQAILRRSFLDIFAKATGGVSHTLHGHMDYAINNKFFPDEGDEETVVRWGTLYGTPRNEATKTVLTIEITGTTGGTVADDTKWARSDGRVYSQDGSAVVPAAGTVQINIIDDGDGADGNMSVSDAISLQQAQAGVESEATVAAVVTEGANQEELEDYRTRVLERLRFPPSGGTVNDYIAYAKTVTGVTRAWVLPGYLGQGTVGLTFVEDDDPVDIIPDAAKVDEVQDAVTELKPVTADLTTFAPIESEMNPQIQIRPNTPEVQAAVIAELEDLLAREAQVRGASDPTEVGLGTTYTGVIRRSQIQEAISVSDGEEDHVLLSPTADVQPSDGGLVTLGTPVFTTLPE